METRGFKWRTAPIGTEGVQCVYVHSATGSDLFGDGTRLNPYQTLGRAYRVSTKPNYIIPIGLFSENMADGNHNCTIMGDYPGAAVFDGQNQYVIYGFRHTNMTIINTGIGSNDLSVSCGSPVFAGVGSAGGGNVGYAGYVCGVAGSFNLIDNSGLYWGVAGGITACKYVGFSRPKAGHYKISLGCCDNNYCTHLTLYDCVISDRSRKVTNNGRYLLSLFAHFDMFADDVITYTSCMFTSDCNWYYTDRVETGTPMLKIVIDTLSESETVTFTVDAENGVMTIGGGGVTDIPSAVSALRTAERITTQPTFQECKFSQSTSAQVFNNPTKQDLTLKVGCDAIINDSTYYGAFPPCINVPILFNSTGVPGSWDEHTADGILSVNENNDIIMEEGGLASEGSIMSKIIKVNTATTMLSAIYSAYASKFADTGCALWRNNLTGDEFSAGDTLPIGRYLVSGTIEYNGVQIGGQQVLVVSTDGTTFTNVRGSGVLRQLKDANVCDAVYVRTSPTIYNKVKMGQGLQRGATYFNFGLSTITYRGRQIVPGESFMAENAVDDFVAPSADYELGIMFDDTRVPSAEWIPAALWDELFVIKDNGTVMLDEEGVPVGSGNYKAFVNSQDGGYAAGRRNYLRQKYFQFQFYAKCVYGSVE